jgi:hypothetical protein
LPLWEASHLTTTPKYSPYSVFAFTKSPGLNICFTLNLKAEIARVYRRMIQLSSVRINPTYNDELISAGYNFLDDTEPLSTEILITYQITDFEWHASSALQGFRVRAKQAQLAGKKKGNLMLALHQEPQ